MTMAPVQVEKSIFFSPILEEDVAGFPNDPRPIHEDVVSIIAIIEDAGIPCCFVNEYALIYYGAGRVQNVGSRIDILKMAKSQTEIKFRPFRTECCVSQMISTRKP